MSTTPVTTAAPATVSTWNVDPAHSSAEFKVRHMMISNVKGKFNGISGTLVRNEADPTACKIDAIIPANTLTTGDEQRDGHLKSPDFLDVEKFPTITFKSLSVRVTGSGEHEVTGELTIHGVTKVVTLAVDGPSAPAKDPWGNTRIGLSATGKINRKDFGLNWNSALETGGVLVGEEVTITLDVQFIKAA